MGQNVMVLESEQPSQQGCSSLQPQTQASPTFSQGKFFLSVLLLFAENFDKFDSLSEIREVMRKLSPPPSERDYIFSLSQGETLPELFEDDLI